MTAAEAYKRTFEAANGETEYFEDHEDIVAEIEDACDDGEYSCDFIDYEYKNMEKHMEDLRKDGFSVEYVEGTGTLSNKYVVSWKHAAPGAVQQ